jgi:hypothetical protein
VTWSADNNSEVVATFKDGHFYKFPAGIDKDELGALVDALVIHNEGQEIITPEVEAAREVEKAQAEQLINDLNGVSDAKPTKA